MNESPELAAAWDRAILLSGDADKPASESSLKVARAGHRNALVIVEKAIAEASECETCGPLEECPSATPDDFAKRDALRALAILLGITVEMPASEAADVLPADAEIVAVSEPPSTGPVKAIRGEWRSPFPAGMWKALALTYLTKR